MTKDNVKENQNKNEAEDEFVYTASGETCESTYGTYKEALDELTKSQSWGVVLKHKPFARDEEPQPEEVVYEHLPELKP